jgi:hypothetical protein
MLGRAPRPPQGAAPTFGLRHFAACLLIVPTCMYAGQQAAIFFVDELNRELRFHRHALRHALACARTPTHTHTHANTLTRARTHARTCARTPTTTSEVWYGHSRIVSQRLHKLAWAPLRWHRPCQHTCDLVLTPALQHPHRHHHPPFPLLHHHPRPSQSSVSSWKMTSLM